MNPKPVIVKAQGGEYSTVELPSGIVETIFFADDGSSKVIGRTFRKSVMEIAGEHIREFEG